MKAHLLHSTLGITLLFAACTPEGNTPGGSGGASVPGSGGASSGSGGAAPSSGGAPGSGGANASGGATPQTGGAPGTGGSATGSGGRPGSGGAATGTGGGATGGRGSGGMTGTAGGSGTGGRGGAGTGSGGAAGSTTPGTCVKGQTKGAEVVIMGESFYAFPGEFIRNRIQENARKAGSLGANEQYRSVAVSGRNMAYIANEEWTAATQGGTVKWVIMDGGGIDCIGGSCSTCANTFKTLLGKMATANVQGVIYTRYPEPGAPPGSDKALKACLDSVMPMMQPVCEGLTSPKCHWVDLRPVWVAGDTTDGLHPTQSGGNHVGDLIWSEMVKQCFAQ